MESGNDQVDAACEIAAYAQSQTVETTLKIFLASALVFSMSVSSAFAQTSNGSSGPAVPETGATVPKNTKGLPSSASPATHSSDTSAEGLPAGNSHAAAGSSMNSNEMSRPADTANGMAMEKKKDAGAAVPSTGKTPTGIGAPSPSGTSPQ
jgi:hypothetical protein